MPILFEQGSGYTGTRNSGADFKDGSSLSKHASDHCGAFGYKGEQQYLDGARKFFNNPPSGVESFTSKGGTYFQYDASTNTFGIINEYGGISTFFKPDAGYSYWLEQIKLYRP